MEGMDARDVVLSVVMVFSAAILVYKWLGLYNKTDPTIIFFAALLVASLALLLLSIELRMQKIMDEFQSIKRIIAVNTDELESRMNSTFRANLKNLEERLETLERRLYR
jgi:hypothetical protein